MKHESEQNKPFYIKKVSKGEYSWKLHCSLRSAKTISIDGMILLQELVVDRWFHQDSRWFKVQAVSPRNTQVEFPAEEETGRCFLILGLNDDRLNDRLAAPNLSTTPTAGSITARASFPFVLTRFTTLLTEGRSSHLQTKAFQYRLQSMVCISVLNNFHVDFESVSLNLISVERRTYPSAGLTSSRSCCYGEDVGGLTLKSQHGYNQDNSSL